jgi:P-type Ca2+ transporter type 2A
MVKDCVRSVVLALRCPPPNPSLISVLSIAVWCVIQILAFFEEGEDQLAAFFEPLVIALILIANAIIGVLQESKAENAIDALKEYEPERAVVVRDGVTQTVNASELVPGDVVVVSAGARLPADVRFAQLHSVTLGVDQAILTGESDTIQKHSNVVPIENAVNQDKTNVGFAGSFVTRGKATGVVIATALRTEIGKIKVKLDETEETATPLKIKLDEFADQLSKYITVICILVWLINIHHFSDPDHGGLLRGAIYYFKIAVALAVAAIPEGLPTVVTTCLALGTMKMAERNALVRSLPAVETLGCTTVICSDKTGTITTNKMSVSRVVYVESAGPRGANPQLVTCSVEGLDFSPNGRVLDTDGNQLHNLVASHSAVSDLSMICSLCNGSSVNYSQAKQAYLPVGEPTEVALKVLVEKLGAHGDLYHSLDQQSLEQRALACNRQWEQAFYKTATLEFSRDRKSMSVVVNKIEDDPSTALRYLLCKGAPEGVLGRCTGMRLNRGGATVPFTKSARSTIDAKMQEMAAQGLRVLAMAMVENPEEHMSLANSNHFVDYERDMTFVGLVAMMDPPREQVRHAIDVCRQAGIRVIMITGDNKVRGSGESGL